MKNDWQKVISLPLIGKDELNLIECPFTLLTDRAGGNQKTLEFTDRQNEIIRNWTITGSDKYGLPCALDEPIFIAMLFLTKRDGFNNRKIYFNPYELLKIMKWPTGSQYYDRLKLSLDRLHDVGIHADYLWDNGEFIKQIKSIGFHILDEYEIVKGIKGNKNSWFKWGERLFESFIHGNFKNLNLDVYFDLKSPISKRFYRLWDKRLYKRDQVSFDLKDLCHEKLGISRNLIYPSLLKQALNPALKEHKEKKLLSSATYIKGKGGNWFLNIKRYRDNPEPEPLPLMEPAVNDQIRPKEDPLLERLSLLKIPAKRVETLLKEYSHQKIEAWVEAIPKIKPENPAGYLISALSEDWPLHPEAQKYLDAITFELEKELREKYNQFIIDQVEKHLGTMNPEKLTEEREQFKTLFMLHWGIDEISPVWVPKFEQDFKWQKAKILKLLDFEQWRSNQVI